MYPSKKPVKKAASLLMALVVLLSGLSLAFPAVADSGAQASPVEFQAAGAPGQQWVFNKLPYYTIQNKENGKYLTLTWSGETPVVTTADYTGERNQRWRLATEQTGLNLNQVNIINAAPNAEGREILLGFDDGTKTFSPYNEPLHGSACFLLSGSYTTAPADGSELSLDLLNWYKIDEQALSLTIDADGDAAFAPSATEGDKQTWVFSQSADAVYTVKNSKTGRYLTFDGAALTTQAAAGDGSQQWFFKSQESFASGNLINAQYGKAIGAGDPEAASGTPAKATLQVNMNHALDNGYAMLQLDGAGNGKPAPEEGGVHSLYLVDWYALAGGSRAVLTDAAAATAAPENPQDNVALQKKNAEAAGQQWTFVQAPYYRIKNKTTGLYLTWNGAQLVTGEDNAENRNQWWTLDNTKADGMSGQYLNLIGYYGKLVGSNGSGDAAALDMTQLPVHGPAMLRLSGAYTLTPENGSEHTIDLVEWYKNAGAAQFLAAAADHTAQLAAAGDLWVFETVPGAYYRIRNEGTGKFLAISGGKLTTTPERITGEFPLTDVLLWQTGDHDVAGGALTLRHVDTGKYIGCNEETGGLPTLNMNCLPEHGGSALTLSGAKVTTPAAGTAYFIEIINWYPYDGAAAVFADIGADDPEPPQPADSNVAWQKKADGAPGQKWNFEELHLYRLKNKATGEYLTWDGAALKTAAKDTADDNQLWTFTPNGADQPGLLNMVNYSGRLIGGTEVADATALNTTVFPSNGGALLLLSGQYETAPASGAERTVDIAWYKIGASTASLSVSGGAALLEAQDGSDKQTWVFEKEGAAYYRIQNDDTKHYLTIADGPVLASVPGATGDTLPVIGPLLWAVTDAGNAHVQSVNLTHVQSGRLVGTAEASPPVIDLDKMHTNGGGSLLIDGQYTLTPGGNAPHTIETISWYNFDGTPGALTELYDPPPKASEFRPKDSGAEAQKWLFEAVSHEGTDAWRIQNADTGKYLTLAEDRVFTSGDALDDGSQAWVFVGKSDFGAVHLKNLGSGKLIGAGNTGAAGASYFPVVLSHGDGTGQALLQINGQAQDNPVITEGAAYTIELIAWYPLAGDKRGCLTDMSGEPEPEPDALNYAPYDNTSESQLWALQPIEFYQLKNKATGLYLTWNGATLTTAAKSQDDGQLWSLGATQAEGMSDYANLYNISGVLVGCNESPSSVALDMNKGRVHGGAMLRLSGRYALSPGDGTQHTIDIVDWFKLGSDAVSLSVDAGGNALLEAKSEADKQTWIFEKTTRSYYTLQNIGTGARLTYDGETVATQTDERGDGSQVWSLSRDAAKNAFSLIHYKTGKRLGSNAAAAAEGEAFRVTIGNDAADNGSYFRLNNDTALVQPSPGAPYALTLLDAYSVGGKAAALNDLSPMLTAGRFVYAPGGSAAGRADHPSTVWSMVAVGEDYLLYDTLTQQCLTAKDGTVVGARRSGLATQLWRMSENNGRTTFRNVETGTYLALSTTDDTVILTAAANDNARWIYTSDKLLQNVWSEEGAAIRYLQMFIRDTEAEGTLMLETMGNKRSQQYGLIEVELDGTTYYKIQSSWSELVLTAVDDKRVEEKAHVDGNDDSQLWELKEIKSSTFVALNIINKGSGLAMSLVDPFNMTGGTGSTIQLVGADGFANGQSMWYLNGTYTINTRVRMTIAPLYPSSIAITSRGAEVVKPLPPVDTRTIYVSAAGNDANTGFSETQAIKTISRLNELIASMPLTAGNTIKLRRGDTFTGTIHLTGNRGREDAPITITGYGAAAANPKLVAPPILTKTQVEAELAAGRPVSYNSAKGEIKNGTITSALLVENCENVVVDGLDGYSDNNAEDFYQYINDPTGLFQFNGTTGLAVKNCDLSGVIQRRIKDYIADVTGENRVLEGYPGGWNASYPPFRGNDYHGLLINNSIGYTNTDMTNIVVENVTATKLTTGITVRNSTQFTVRSFKLTDSPCWGISVDGSSAGQVVDCETNNTGYGLNPNGNAAFMVGSSQDVVFDNIRAYNSQRGPQPYDGVAFDFEGGINQRDVTLRNAVIDGVDGAGIMIFSNTDGNRDFIIDNVFIQNYLRGGDAQEGAIFFIQDFGNGMVVNTTVVANRVNGVMMPYYGYLQPDRLGAGRLFYPADVPDVIMIDCSFTTGVDKTALKTLIEQADALKESDYTASSWAAFKTALDNAKFALSNEYMSEAVIGEYRDALKTAMDGLVKKTVAPPATTAPPTTPTTPPDPGGQETPGPSPGGDPTPGGDLSGQEDDLTLEQFLAILEAAEGDMVSIKLQKPPVITAAMWTALRDAGKGLRLQVVDEEDAILYAWTFTDIVEDAADFNSALLDESANGDAITALLGDGRSQTVFLSHTGALPGAVQLIVRNTAGFKAGDVLYLKYYDPDTGELVEAGKVSVSSDNQYLAFNLAQDADYVIQQAAAADVQPPRADDDPVSPGTSNPRGGLPTWAIVLLSVGGGVVVLGAAVTAVILISKKKKAATA